MFEVYRKVEKIELKWFVRFRLPNFIVQICLALLINHEQIKKNKLEEKQHGRYLRVKHALLNI